MIIGLGTDIVEVARIEKIHASFGSHFLQKILTTNERTFLQSPRSETIAGLFAAKEAAVKALGTGFAHGISANNIEILHNDSGAPYLHFYGAAAERLASMSVKQTFLSISHERHYAIATVILEA